MFQKNMVLQIVLHQLLNKLINDRNKVESYGEITIKDTIFVDAIN